MWKKLKLRNIKENYKARNQKNEPIVQENPELRSPS